MSDDSFVDEDEAERNINEFIEEHDTEGLFVLYFRQFIYRFIIQELKSTDDQVEDIGTQLHLSADNEEVLKNHRTKIQARCEHWARDLVDHLKDDRIVSEVIEAGDLERLEDKEVENRVKDAIDEKLEKWNDQLEIFLEELE